MREERELKQGSGQPNTQVQAFEVHCWCSRPDRASTLLHCYRVYIHVTVTGGVIQFQEINRYPPRCCGSPPQWSGTGVSFFIPSRILAKYTIQVHMRTWDHRNGGVTNRVSAGRERASSRLQRLFSSLNFCGNWRHKGTPADALGTRFA